jgi:hypothetical protein
MAFMELMRSFTGGLASSTMTSDIEQLRQAGFNVIVDDANPPVKDRINSMNAMFCNGNGAMTLNPACRSCSISVLLALFDFLESPEASG